MASARSVILHDGQLLMLRRRSDSRSGRPGQWSVPGGRTHQGELPAAACLRETREETGLTVRIQRPIARFRAETWYLCTLSSPSTPITLQTRENTAYAWVQPAELLILGPLMDLRRLLTIFSLLGLPAPPPPDGIIPAAPDEVFF